MRKEEPKKYSTLDRIVGRLTETPPEELYEPAPEYLSRIVGAMAVVAGSFILGFAVFMFFETLPGPIHAIVIAACSAVAFVGASLVETGYRMAADRPRPDGSVFAPVTWYVIGMTSGLMGTAMVVAMLARGEMFAGLSLMAVAGAVLFVVLCSVFAWLSFSRGNQGREARRALEE